MAAKAELNTPTDRMAKLLRKMGRFETGLKSGGSSLQLLDLPIDVLKLIISEINHTNDLTALALTHSVLHALVIPQMYSRFDIVWPESSRSSEPRTGVDALAFGLSTLVMSRSVFDHVQTRVSSGRAQSNESRDDREDHVDRSWRHYRKRRKGNNYAQYTRKFSLGNGHSAMIGEYLIHKEGGKMLGTLAALAVAKMQNLETFVWDMPTGIVQDVWEALASLSEESEADPPRLHTVWVRFHDSTLTRRSPNYTPVTLQQSAAQNINPTTLSNHGGLAFLPPTSHISPSTSSSNIEVIRQSYQQTEYPNFSILPPLKCVTALEIDQIAYIDELSILIERSLSRLSELRIGIAVPRSGHYRGFTAPHAPHIGGENDLDFPDFGGILGMLFSRFYDFRRHHTPDCLTEPKALSADSILEKAIAHDTTVDLSMNSDMSPALHWSQSSPLGDSSSPEPRSKCDAASLQSPIDGVERANAHHGLGSSQGGDIQSFVPRGSKESAITAESPTPVSQKQAPEKKVKQRKLNLTVLELEHVTLNPRPLIKAIDWKHLTSLTLLYCHGDHDLWRILKKLYPPRSDPSDVSAACKHRPQDYPLKIKRLHTNSVTPSLLQFLKENLAPNSLEALFLQDRDPFSGSDSVEIENIYRGPLRHHRASLKKLTIESEEKVNKNKANAWKRWAVTGEALRFITSGKMPHLRELCISLDYREFHTFLQCLPNMRHLRSLYIPHFKGLASVRAPSTRTRELALQVLDVVALRPEVELCYLGIIDKCFEIMEGPAKDDGFVGIDTDEWFVRGLDDSDTEDDDEDDDDDDDDEDEDNDWQQSDVSSDGGANNGADIDVTSDTADGDISDGSVSDCDEASRKPKFKLREILFYAERVEIFKVRNARL